MTRDRATRPGPRTVAQQGRGRRGRLPAASALAGIAAFVLVACGSGPGPSGNAGPAGSVSAGGSSVTVAGSSSPAAGGGSVAPAGSPGPGGSVERWPGTTVLATIALGAADGEIQKAGNDLQAAAASEDLKAMWGAADGLAKMIDGLTPNIARLEIYPKTQPAAVIYRKALPEIGDGAKQLRDAITAGDANGIVAGSRLIQQGLVDYEPVRPIIAGLVEEAIVQQRLLLQ